MGSSTLGEVTPSPLATNQPRDLVEKHIYWKSEAQDKGKSKGFWEIKTELKELALRKQTRAL